MARVLVSDRLSDEGLEILERAAGIEVDYRPDLGPDELAGAIAGCQGLIIRSGTKVTAEVLAAADELRVIGRAGIGVDNVDLQVATERGVIVMNTPEGNAITTAEHAIALMTSLARRIPQATASMRAGVWDKTRLSGLELFERTLGVIGLGNIGSIVADRARGLRMRVIAFDPVVSEDRAQRLGVDLVSLDELFERSDVITCHVPLTDTTRGLIGRDAFARMRRGVLVINAARGGIVDEAALLEALESGHCAGAALDVFETEPPPPDHPLLARDDVVLTPHLGAATAQAQLNVAIAVAEQVVAYLSGGVVRNAVNMPSLSADDLEELRPFITLGEKLGLFQGQVSDDISEIDVEYAGAVAELNVQPITIAVVRGLLLPWCGATVNYVNAPVIAQQRGIRVIESKAAEPEDFVSLISVRVRTKAGREHLACGAIFGRTQPRIVRVDNFRFEAIPEGPTLLLRNVDQPGVVGQVGTLLGDSGVNIARMQLGLDPVTGEALQLLSVPGGDGRRAAREGPRPSRTPERQAARPGREGELMPNVVCVGAQWGDEGKGKVVDRLAPHADLVVRFQGGPNAGHTLVVEGRTTILHLIPSGILVPGTLNVIGPGVVVDPEVLLEELAGLQTSGVAIGRERLRISDRAHVILPVHRALDRAREDASGRRIGTTGRGIGPVYESRVSRTGVRVCDLLEPEHLRERLQAALHERSFLLEKLYGQPPTDVDALHARCVEWGEKLAPYVDDVGVLIDRALRDDRSVLFEGAQGTLLDVDHGTYPFVTSSTTLAGGACAGAGIGPTRIDHVLGITKAYTTRVGSGPFPTEDHGPAGEHLGTVGAEFGATTGRKRRCGWLDLVVLRHAVRVNGITGLALLKLDVLTGLDEVKVCVGYRVGGKELPEFPASPRVLDACEPVYETHPGWSEPIDGARRVEDLPAAARAYVEMIESALEVPAHLIGVGPERDATIERAHPLGG